jgi:hypothetical protein
MALAGGQASFAVSRLLGVCSCYVVHTLWHHTPAFQVARIDIGETANSTVLHCIFFGRRPCWTLGLWSSVQDFALVAGA